MKRGTTPTLEIKLELNATDVTDVYFTFKEKVEDSDNYLLQKNYPEDATYDDEKEVFLLPLTQEDTLKLTDTYFLEAEVVIGGKSVIKSDIGKEIMQPTLYTEVISGNESNGESDVISLSFTDYVKGEGGSSGSYNDLSDKPKFNNIVWQGNKTDSDMGIATKGELQTKADKSDTYTKEETNTFLNAKADKSTTYTKTETDTLLDDKQNHLQNGNGIDIEQDRIIGIDLASGNQQLLKFLNGQLILQVYDVAYNSDVRTELANSSIPNSLASKSYVDDLMSGATKWEFVQQLPTENIDIHTIYFVPKQSAETDNIYDEWVYAIQSRNPDVYDWELLGTSQVDLSNYYTKTESDNKYQAILTNGNGIDITNNVVSVETTDKLSFDTNGLLDINRTNLGYDSYFRQVLVSTTSGATHPLASKDYADTELAKKQDKLTAGTNITIDSNNVISASGGGSYSGGDGIDITNDTISVDLKSGTELQITSGELDIDLSSYATTTDLSSKQDTIDTTHKLSADLVDDTSATNKFVSATEKSTWNGKADDTVISTDTTSTTVSLTLADNHEYRYTQDLTSLTLTMPNGDFISSIVFASGSTPTSMTYDSSIKWSGDDVTNGQFVPTEKTYNIVMWYDGLNVNGVVRGV